MKNMYVFRRKKEKRKEDNKKTGILLGCFFFLSESLIIIMPHLYFCFSIVVGEESWPKTLSNNHGEN